MILNYLFYGSIFIIFYTYLIYPILIGIISRICNNIVHQSEKDDISASILISAYNEESEIENRILNISKLEGISSLNIEVLIGSDGSDDGTNEILKKLKSEFKWLKIFLFDERRGKSLVLNDLIKEACHDILIFTDANTHFNKRAVQKLLEGFNNLDVGGVSGRLILKDKPRNLKKGIEERKYWEYETIIKKSEGKCGILIGANGSIYAVRKTLIKTLPEDKAVTDDFYITLTVLNQNKYFIYNEDAIGIEYVAPTIISEFRRKVRFSATNFVTIKLFYSLLFSKKFLLSFSLWSHKLFRWIVPHLLILILISNILLLNTDGNFLITMYFQVLLYGSSMVFYILSRMGFKIRIISLINYFNLTNAALFIGFLKFLFNKQSPTWNSTPRK